MADQLNPSIETAIADLRAVDEADGGMWCVITLTRCHEGIASEVHSNMPKERLAALLRAIAERVSP